MDVWARLALYESTDLIRGLFVRRHGREVNAEKAREIASAVAQGREYLMAAENAGPLVRPLLQYYGVLSLSRALILLLSTNLREASLPKAHGLSASGWGTLLAPATWKPSDLEVNIRRGTFHSLLEITKNSTESTVFTGPYPARLTFLRSWPIPSEASRLLPFAGYLLESRS